LTATESYAAGFGAMGLTVAAVWLLWIATIGR
jgi:DHA1 family inner membrane transport protein